ncbi:MAG: uroporphyrinogen decarboxylase [Gammaproteobacteria bacterium]|nr:uroporphyrinogen decarboxylase [Gammaproteobacteria bacterium]
MRLLDALAHVSLDRPPIWFMRQAGRYLPEYQELRSRFSFQQAVHDPELAAEITMQPVRRFSLDAAIVFSDIMTPLEGMGVAATFDPGPKLRPHGIEEVEELPELDAAAVDFVGEAISLARAGLDDATAIIGFAGGPVTLLAYLIEGQGSKDFLGMRSALEQKPEGSERALAGLGRAMNAYLRMQVSAGAQAVQLFDSWAGALSRSRFARFAVPAARLALADLGVPTIYFAPHAAHNLDLFSGVGATGYGVDWRVPIDEAWDRIGSAAAIQGNLDPAVLLTDPATVQFAVTEILEAVGGRPGHVFNLGHGIHHATPVENVAAMVAAVRGVA